jgi:hypothetical protein
MNSPREFLQKITGGLVVLNLPAESFASSNPSSPSPYEGPVLRVAIMGLGSYGTRVAEAMQSCKMAKLTGIISGTPAKIKDWQSKYHIPEGNCYNYENFDQIKDNPEIDAVYVITPNALHHDQVIRDTNHSTLQEPVTGAEPWLLRKSVNRLKNVLFQKGKKC